MSKTTINKKIYLIARTAILSAIAVTLAILESFLPDLPFVLPGMKLGLSNICVMIAIEVCPLPAVLYIAVVKSFFALVTRGATAFFMSFTGAILSSLLMYMAVHLKKVNFGCLGIGVLGAFAHNIGQLFAAYFIVGKAAFAYLPFISLFAVFTGAITALVYYFSLPAVTKAAVFH